MKINTSTNIVEKYGGVELLFVVAILTKVQPSRVVEAGKLHKQALKVPLKHKTEQDC